MSNGRFPAEVNIEKSLNIDSNFNTDNIQLQCPGRMGGGGGWGLNFPLPIPRGSVYSKLELNY